MTAWTVLAWSEMQTTITDSINNDDNCDAKCDSHERVMDR